MGFVPWHWRRSASSPSPRTSRGEGTPAEPVVRGRTRAFRAVRRTALAAALLVVAGAVALAVIWQRMEPLALSRAEALSVTVLDRNDRLLRAYTTADGRWRLPVEVKDVDPRYLDLLVGDALYLQAPFVKEIEALGLDWAFTLKENQPDLLREAARLTQEIGRAHV